MENEKNLSVLYLKKKYFYYVSPILNVYLPNRFFVPYFSDLLSYLIAQTCQTLLLQQISDFIHEKNNGISVAEYSVCYFFLNI